PNTTSRGASNRRVTVSSRCRAAAAALSLAPIPLFFRFELAQIVVQPVEPLVPEPAVVLDPLGGVLQRRRLQPARPPLRFAAARDQAGALQHLQMLRDGGKAHREGF